MKKKIFLFLTLILAVLVPLVAGNNVFAKQFVTVTDHTSNRIMVKFRPGTPDNIKTQVNRNHGGIVERTVPELDIQVIRVSGNQIENKVRQYKSEAVVMMAEADVTVKPSFNPNDSFFGSQWGFKKVQVPQAWNTSPGSPLVKIAILDSGIDPDHPDLKGKIAAEKNFTDSDTTGDRYGHGTHVAGIAAASTNNDTGVSGVGFFTKLMNVKVLSDGGGGSYSAIIDGIVWAADNGAKVINMSFGGSVASDAMQQAVEYAWGKGVVLVAAAGNSDTSNPGYPTSYPQVLSVGATDSNDARAGFSNYGDWVRIAAPGVGIISTMPLNQNAFGLTEYGTLTGSSMASPMVAGVAALLMAAKPDLTNAEVVARLMQTGDPTTGFPTSIPRVNAFRAVFVR